MRQKQTGKAIALSAIKTILIKTPRLYKIVRTLNRKRVYMYPRLKYPIKYLFGIYDFSKFLAMAQQQSPAATLATIHKEYRYWKPHLIHFLTHLFSYIMSDVESSCNIEKGTDYIIHLCCWDPNYTYQLLNYLYPSMLAEGNLPSISKHYKSIILIHCSEATRTQLLNARISKHIRKYAAIEYLIIPAELTNHLKYKPKFFIFKNFKLFNNTVDGLKYIILGTMQSQALASAVRHKTYISFLLADLVLSNHFFNNAFSVIKQKRVVLVTTLKTNYHSINTFLTEFFNPDKTQLSIPAKTCRALEVDHLHPWFKRRIVSPSTPYFTPSPQLIFRTESSMILRVAHYNPILINTRVINHSYKVDYNPIDFTLVNRLLSQHQSIPEQIIVCDHSSNIDMVEITDGDAEPFNLCGTPKFQTYTSLVQNVCSMIISNPYSLGTPLCRYLFSIENKFESSSHQKTGEHIDSDKFLADVYKMVETSKQGYKPIKAHLTL